MIDSLGAMWLHQDRNTYGRRACSVELLYRKNAAPGFGWNEARNRVQIMLNKGVEVHLRVDNEPGQTIPATNDWNERWYYIDYFAQLARDSVFGRCKSFIVGNEFNVPDEYRITGIPYTPSWVAGIVYGYGRPSSETDNIYQNVKTFAPSIRVMIGAIGPYQPSQYGLQGLTYSPPDSRNSLSPWERWQYELAICCYQNNWHAPYNEITFAMHCYARINAQHGANEPWEDVREGTYLAQFGTKTLDDMLNAIHNANGFNPPPILVSEWNSYTDSWPDQNYPVGLLRNAVAYVNFKPNVIGFCNFVDQNYGVAWARTSMTAQPTNPHIASWNADFDYLLKNGW